MASIKIKRTRKGITYHIRDIFEGKDSSRRVLARSLAEAKKQLAVHEYEKMTKAVPTLFVKDVPFSHALDEYAEYSRHRKRESTYNKDLSTIKTLRGELGAVNVREVTSVKVQALQSKWKDDGYSNKTINNRSVLLGTILKHAKELNYMNEMPKINKFKVDSKRPEFFTEQEMDRILSAAKPFLQGYLKVLLYSGMRAGELKNLKLSDIDVKNRLIRVEVSKSHKFRTIPINNILEPLIAEKIKNKTEGQNYLFEINEGRPVSDFYHRFKKLLKSLGMKGHLHKLRHTFASWLVQNNVPIYDVQHLLGHASVQTTQRYAHVRMDNLKKAVESLPEVLSSNDKGCD